MGLDVGAALELSAPWNLLCLLAVIPALLASAEVRRRRARALAALGLPGERRRAVVAMTATLAGAIVFVALAAADPLVRTNARTSTRADAQAYVIVDTSMSMLARPSRSQPTRIAVARRLAAEVAARLPATVPVGLATMPEPLLPVLVPTTNRSLLDTVLDRVAVVGALPAKPKDQLSPNGAGFTPTQAQANAPYVATSMSALDTLVLAGFFGHSATHRLAVLVTDAETAGFSVTSVRRLLARAGIGLLVLRVGSDRDRLWRSIRGTYTLDPGYAPAVGAMTEVAALARSLGGGLYRPGELRDLSSRARQLLGTGDVVVTGRVRRTIVIGPYLALAGLALVALLLAEALPLSAPTGLRRRLSAVLALRGAGRASRDRLAGVDP